MGQLLRGGKYTSPSFMYESHILGVSSGANISYVCVILCREVSVLSHRDSASPFSQGTKNTLVVWTALCWFKRLLQWHMTQRSWIVFISHSQTHNILEEQIHSQQWLVFASRQSNWLSVCTWLRWFPCAQIWWPCLTFKCLQSSVAHWCEMYSARHTTSNDSNE